MMYLVKTVYQEQYWAQEVVVALDSDLSTTAGLSDLREQNPSAGFGGEKQSSLFIIHQTG